MENSPEIPEQIIELIKKEDNFLTSTEIIDNLKSELSKVELLNQIYRKSINNKIFVVYGSVNLYGLREWFQSGTFVLEPEYALKMLNKQKEL